MSKYCRSKQYPDFATIMMVHDLSATRFIDLEDRAQIVFTIETIIVGRC